MEILNLKEDVIRRKRKILFIGPKEINYDTQNNLSSVPELFFYECVYHPIGLEHGVALTGYRTMDLLYNKYDSVFLVGDYTKILVSSMDNMNSIASLQVKNMYDNNMFLTKAENKLAKAVKIAESNRCIRYDFVIDGIIAHDIQGIASILSSTMEIPSYFLNHHYKRYFDLFKALDDFPLRDNTVFTEEKLYGLFQFCKPALFMYEGLYYLPNGASINPEVYGYKLGNLTNFFNLFELAQEPVGNKFSFELLDKMRPETHSGFAIEWKEYIIFTNGYKDTMDNFVKTYMFTGRQPNLTLFTPDYKMTGASAFYNQVFIPRKALVSVWNMLLQPVTKNNEINSYIYSVMNSTIYGVMNTAVNPVDNQYAMKKEYRSLVTVVTDLVSAWLKLTEHDLLFLNYLIDKKTITIEAAVTMYHGDIDSLRSLAVRFPHIKITDYTVSYFLKI
jgi:hypothetical protein